MTDNLRYPYDRPDHYDDVPSPSFNRPIRHGKLKHPVAVWCLGILAGCAIGGGVGAVMIVVLTWAGVVE